ANGTNASLLFFQTTSKVLRAASTFALASLSGTFAGAASGAARSSVAASRPRTIPAHTTLDVFMPIPLLYGLPGCFAVRTSRTCSRRRRATPPRTTAPFVIARIPVMGRGDLPSTDPCVKEQTRTLGCSGPHYTLALVERFSVSARSLAGVTFPTGFVGAQPD